MKPQDIIFILILLFLIYKRDVRLIVIFGLGCIILSIPFYMNWIFFTAERLTIYSFGYLLLAIILLFFQE